MITCQSALCRQMLPPRTNQQFPSQFVLALLQVLKPELDQWKWKNFKKQQQRSNSGNWYLADQRYSLETWNLAGNAKEKETSKFPQPHGHLSWTLVSLLRHQWVILLVYALIAYPTISLPQRALQLLCRRRLRVLCPPLSISLWALSVEEKQPHSPLYTVIITCWNKS